LNMGKDSLPYPILTAWAMIFMEIPSDTRKVKVPKRIPAKSVILPGKDHRTKRQHLFFAFSSPSLIVMA
jgi:hypothetical protein